MSRESVGGQRDLMHVGPYLVSFDEAGADIEHRSTHARYRVQAATASNAVAFMQHHKRLIFAMMSNDPGELQAFSIQPHTEGRTA
jgi:hypothetical protein